MSKLKKKEYESLLEPMQVELNNLAHWLRHTGTRMMVLIEGRDTAGKGGLISAVAERLNPRQARVVALAKPTERERTQWYFQRYISHMPAAGEMVLFDRSWYNRAGVEKVMGYCTPAEYERFLRQAPVFEKMLVDDGILLLKYWLTVDQEQQEKRFSERADDPLKRWKLSPIDLEARERYVEYGRARDVMFEATHTAHAPHLLDQTPDLAVPDIPIELKPLKGGPEQDRFDGPVKPIPSRY